MIVGIDPGTKACGVGVLDAVSRLTAAKLIQGTSFALPLAVLDYVTEVRRTGSDPIEPLRVVVEYPQAYLPGQQKGDQNDLIRLALVAGACAGMIKARFPYAEVELILPRAWKGTIDPDVFTHRIEGRLSPEEVARIERCAAGLRHNVLDGIGLALHAAGRMERKRIYE